MTITFSKKRHKESNCRILIVSPSEWVHGGVQNYIYTTLSAINRSNFLIDFYSPRQIKDFEFAEKMSELGVDMYFGEQSEGKRPNTKRVWNDLHILCHNNKYAVIHINTGAPIFQAICVLSAFIHHIPRRICHSHSAVTNGKLSFIHCIFYALCRMLIISLATDFFACSELAGRFLFGNKTMKKSGVIIRNGIDLRKYSFSEMYRDKIRTELGIAESIPVVGHVGNFIEAKNHKFLIYIFADFLKICPKAKLILCGDNSNDINARKKIEFLVCELGLKDSVFFLGSVKNVYEYYSAMDVFIMPSLWEGLPYVGVEAQCACLPCLFSDSISHEVELSEWANFFSLKNDASKWAHKTYELLSKSKIENRIAFTKKTYESIQSHGFNLSESVEIVEKIYGGKSK